MLGFRQQRVYHQVPGIAGDPVPHCIGAMLSLWVVEWPSNDRREVRILTNTVGQGFEVGANDIPK